MKKLLKKVLQKTEDRCARSGYLNCENMDYIDSKMMTSSKRNGKKLSMSTIDVR